MNFESRDSALFATVRPGGGMGRRSGTSKQRMRVHFYAALLAADCVAIVAAFAFASLFRIGRAFGWDTIHIVAVTLPLYVVIATYRRAYTALIFSNRRRAAQIAVTSLLASALAVLSISFYLQASAEMSRLIFTIGTTGAVVLLSALRWIVHRIATRRMGGEPMAELLICDGGDAPFVAGGVRVDARAFGLVPDIADPRALDRFGRLIKDADRVVIACAEERRVAWSAMLKGAGVTGEIVTPELGEIGALGASRFAETPTLLVSVGPLSMTSRLAKRALDTSFALAALIVLAPLLLVVALAVKIDSPGPILFAQQRLGRGNRLFRMYKFRSMRDELCDSEGRQSTQRGDKRVTRVGRIIRATSIDELPQILNVLKGDMSVVGPRPHALGSLAGDKLFWEVDTRYWHRHAAKPGITGLAQVRGFRGATHMQSDLIDRLQADLDYVNNWTMWRDLSILVATVRVIFHRNAY